MTHREHFFSVLEGKKPKNMPFMPDITDWYTSMRTPEGEARKFGPAEFIPDSDPFHKFAGTMPAKYRDFTLFDFYREFDWGFPVHIGNWYERQYDGGIERTVTTEPKVRTTVLHTPKGDLVHRDLLAMDGTWCPREHFIKKPEDLDILALVVEAERYVPRYDNVESIMKEMGEWGFGDLVIHRSPFGKLVHEYMGFEQVIYALADMPDYIGDFLVLQEKRDLQLIELASKAPERLVIISDHADENLIAPPYYKEYCIPFYRKACDILHKSGKFVSTHLDGNFKSFFPFIGDTGFDLLDGCTPAPMFNFEVEELAVAMPDGMKAFCGVPSTLFCQGVATKDILAFGDRIMSALKGRGILNVGDILPPNGDIEQVIALGKHVKGIWGR